MFTAVIFRSHLSRSSLLHTHREVSSLSSVSGTERACPDVQFSITTTMTILCWMSEHVIDLIIRLVSYSGPLLSSFLFFKQVGTLTWEEGVLLYIARMEKFAHRELVRGGVECDLPHPLLFAGSSALVPLTCECDWNSGEESSRDCSH